VIVDSSALVSIPRREPEAAEFEATIAEALSLKMSAVGYLEASVVVDSSGDPATSRRLDAYLEAADIQIAPVRGSQAHTARQAYREFGKGSGHPAQLNFGDCFAYALSAESREPLLFKGNDFSRTDISKA
jgi:ribonuclease VapC